MTEYVRIVEELDENGKVKRRIVESNKELSNEGINGLKEELDDTFKEMDDIFKGVDTLFERVSKRMSRIFKRGIFR